MVFIRQTSGKTRQPDTRGVDPFWWNKLNEAIKEARIAGFTGKDLLKDMAAGYSPPIQGNRTTQDVQVEYNDGSTEIFKVHGCNSEASAFYKVLNFHRNTLRTQKPIVTITTKDIALPKPKEIF